MYNKLILTLLFCMFLNCNNDDLQNNPEELVYEYNITESVLVHDEQKVYNNLILVCPNGGKNPYLVDKGGNIVHSWNFDISCLGLALCCFVCIE